MDNLEAIGVKFNAYFCAVLGQIEMKLKANPMFVNLRYVLFALLLFGLTSCAQKEASKPAEAIKVVEYDYLAKEFASKGVKEGYTSKEVLSDSKKVSYMLKEAEYAFKASTVTRDNEELPIATVIDFRAKRDATSLTGGASNKEQVFSLVLPSSYAPAEIWKKYAEEIKKMGVKDYEVYIEYISKMYAEARDR